MTVWLAALALLLALIGIVVAMWPTSNQVARWEIDLEREWSEMQIRRLARDARARMYRAVDEARDHQRPDRL